MERTAKLHSWEKMPREHLNDKLDRRIITGDRMMITHVYLKKGCVVPRHQHENEQITYVLEGALRFRLGAEGTQQVDGRAGEVLTIPSNLPHSAEALEDTLDVDIFDPPRRDWLDGTDLYLRRGGRALDSGSRGGARAAPAHDRGMGGRPCPRRRLGQRGSRRARPRARGREARGGAPPAGKARGGGAAGAKR